MTLEHSLEHSDNELYCVKEVPLFYFRIIFHFLRDLSIN